MGGPGSGQIKGCKGHKPSIKTRMKRSKSLKAAWLKRGPQTVEQYIKSKTYKSGKCLLWKGARIGHVGWFQFKGETGGAPRCVYKATVCDLPDSIFILHKCDDQRCVKRQHLYEGTKKDNRRDFMKRHPRAKQLIAAFSAAGVEARRKFRNDDI